MFRRKKKEKEDNAMKKKNKMEEELREEFPEELKEEITSGIPLKEPTKNIKKIAICYPDGTLAEERFVTESELEAILEIPSDVTENEDGTLTVRRKE